LHLLTGVNSATLLLILLFLLTTSTSFGDPPATPPKLKLESPQIEEPLPPLPPELQKQICAHCQALKQISGYQKSTDTARQLEDALGVAFGQHERITFQRDQKTYIYRGVSYDVSDKLILNAGKVGHTGAKGLNISKKFGKDDAGEDFSQKIKDHNKASTDSSR
jgi:hypothetical protein